MLKFSEKHVVTIDGMEIGYIELDDTKQHYVFAAEEEVGLTWADVYAIQCRLSELNEHYIPF